MRELWIGVLSVFLCVHAAQAQEALPPAIATAYDAASSALQSAKSREDIHRMIEAMDTTDWVSIAPAGEHMSRDVAEQQTTAILSTPPGQRPIPLQKIIYVGDLRSNVLVVYWAYRTTAWGIVGSMVRDSWIETQVGWRRSVHEKLFPDRLLTLP